MSYISVELFLIFTQTLVLTYVLYFPVCDDKVKRDIQSSFHTWQQWSELTVCQ